MVQTLFERCKVTDSYEVQGVTPSDMQLDFGNDPQ